MRSMVYASAGGVDLQGDLHLPDGAGPHPVLLGIPGGGWRFGTRQGFAGWGAYFAAQGYALFSIDHRRSTAGRVYPEAVQDVRAALRFLAANATSLGCDASRLGILGSSAGAHLGSLAALSGNVFDTSPSEGPDPVVRAMVLAYGVYDLHTHWQFCRGENAAAGDDFTERFMGITPYDDPWLYAQASPLRHVSYAQNRMAAFLTWGTHDDLVSPSQSEAFVIALRQARFSVRTCPVVGAGHFWFSEDPIAEPRGHTSYVAPRIVRFLDRFLADIKSHAGG